MSRSIQCVFSKTENSQVFEVVDAPRTAPQNFDIEVEVLAVSLNPVDYKVASGFKSSDSPPRVLGWDVAGKVTQVGSSVKTFAVGDEVYYAGDLKRPGGNASYHLVDSRIVAKKPKSLSFVEASALPLTGLTAWEGLFDGLKIRAEQTKGKSLLVIGGAGGVGSMVIQLAKTLTQLKIIATSSKTESTAWCQALGADHVVNYKNGLESELEAIGLDGVDYVFCTNSTESYFDLFAKIVNPFGGIVSIVEVDKPVSLGPLMSKSISFAWELMFTRSLYKTHDMARQGETLAQIASLVDQGKVRTTLNVNLGPMNPANLAKGHELLRSGNTIGKIVMSVE